MAYAFFTDRPRAAALFHHLCSVMDGIGPTEVAETKSRVAFIRRTRFCWVPHAGLDHIRVALWLPYDIRDDRARSRFVAGRWSHHIRIESEAELDDPTFVAWLRDAYRLDGEP